MVVAAAAMAVMILAALMAAVTMVAALMAVLRQKKKAMTTWIWPTTVLAALAMVLVAAALVALHMNLDRRLTWRMLTGFQTPASDRWLSVVSSGHLPSVHPAGCTRGSVWPTCSKHMLAVQRCGRG